MKAVVCFKNNDTKSVEIAGLKSVSNNAKSYKEKEIRTNFCLAPDTYFLIVGEKESLTANSADILYVIFIED